MVAELLGGLTGDQMLTRIMLYQMVGQLLSGALTPYWRALEQGVNQRTPNEVLSPAELASAVVRTFMSEAGAAELAKMSGINEGPFHTLVELAGLAPDPSSLATALRRHIIPLDGPAEGTSFNAGIAQGNLANKWAPVVEQLSHELPSAVNALEALLEGQVTEAQARELYQQWGGLATDPNDGTDIFQIMFNTRGQAPTPTQALELLNRGIIPEEDGEGPDSVSYKQAFLEGPWRNKWEKPFLALREYLPPPRTVTAMVREGSLTDEQATVLFRKYGLSAELAAIYVTSAHHQKTATTHELARTTLQQLYEERVISQQQLATALVDQGWSESDANYLVAVVDAKRIQQAISHVMTRLHTLYVGYKINVNTVQGSLTRIGIAVEQQTDILELWGLERQANTRDLTPAQIESAVYRQIITQDEGQRLLESIGYTPHDAWVALSVRAGKPLPGEPPPDAVPGGN